MENAQTHEPNNTKLKIDKPKQPKKCVTHEIEQHQAKSRQTQTIYKVCKPTKLNNMNPKFDEVPKNFGFWKMCELCRLCGLYKMREPM